MFSYKSSSGESFVIWQPNTGLLELVYFPLIEIYLNTFGIEMLIILYRVTQLTPVILRTPSMLAKAK